MGVLNVTPDSFSDGGCFSNTETAVACALKMLDNGAEIIDIGGESTRPGAEEISPSEELQRVVPVIQTLRKKAPKCIISIDTRKSEVALRAIEAGADIINDISGLQYSKDMAKVAAETNAGLIIMHMRGTPQSMQSSENLEYGDIVEEVKGFLLEATKKAIAAGVAKTNIMLDPGIGFSKNTKQNLEILGNIGSFKELGFPILVGASRKSFIGEVLNEKNPKDRIWGTAGVMAWLSLNNTEIIRVHDIKEMHQVIQLFNECKSYQKEGIE